jgi:PAS domain S-box-containing protein
MAALFLRLRTIVLALRQRACIRSAHEASYDNTFELPISNREFILPYSMSSSPNLAEILAKIGDGVCVLDKNRSLTFVNETASSILETVDDGFQNRISQSINERTSRRFEHFHTALNRWFEHQTYPNEDGGITLFSRDITSRHRLEEALRASEERFRRLMESNIIGVAVLEGEYVAEANDVFLAMVGYTRGELVTRQLHCRQMTPAGYDSLDANARNELSACGVFQPYEKEFFRKDGSRVPIFIGGVATGRESAETVCLALDLTERKRAEERMRSIVESSKILASSLEYQTTFIELADFIASNLADSCAIFVLDEGELIRMAAAQGVPVSESDADPDITAVMRTGKSEINLAPASQILVPILACNGVAGVLVVTAGRPDAFSAEDIHLFNDLGRRAGLALENARLYQETQKANRLKDEFVAIVSHELRTPLTPILGAVYMLRDEAHNENTIGRALDLIERNAKTQLRIVDDLLDVSRALSGKLRLNIESVDLPAVIQSAVETVRSASDAKRIRIDVRLTPLEGTVSGDPDRLQQVVWNLLANAVKFTPAAGEIAVELSQLHDHVEIRVSDTGIGIGAEFLPHVFERFRQADASRTRAHGGLGLGLAIVRHLVESHGGTVHAESFGDAQGSTFVVRLPIRSMARATMA